MATPAVIVFVQTGCPACESFLPTVARSTPALRAHGVPVRVADITRDKRLADLADRMEVRVTPTTFLRTRDGRIYKREGALTPAQFGRFLALAATH